MAWRKILPGRYETTDGRWKVVGEGFGWYLIERTEEGELVQGAFDYLREAKRYVSKVAKERHEEKRRRFVIEHDEIETGNGLHVRLRLLDGLGARHGEVVVDGPTKIRTFLRGDMDSDTADAVGTLLMQAAQIARGIEKER